MNISMNTNVTMNMYVNMNLNMNEMYTNLAGGGDGLYEAVRL